MTEHNEKSRVNLKEKLLDPAAPVVFFEIVPPAMGKPEAEDSTLKEVEKVRHLVDAINIPEIHDEARGSERTAQFVARLEPRLLGARLQRELATEVVINRVTVHDADPRPWFEETCEAFGIQHIVLVGGESAEIRYPGPGPLQAAEVVRSARLPLTLGGITIPSRPNEADRIRSKHAAGMSFFTSQILFDPNDIVWLVQRLNGLEARVLHLKVRNSSGTTATTSHICLLQPATLAFLAAPAVSFSHNSSTSAWFSQLTKNEIGLGEFEFRAAVESNELLVIEGEIDRHNRSSFAGCSFGVMADRGNLGIFK